MTALHDTMRGLLPPGVALALWDGDDAPSEHPEESEIIARAVPARADEFRRGRACARAALAQLGVAPAPILAGEGRAPVWPAGIVGSITHCRGLVAAVAASSERLRGLGLDAEPIGPLPDGTGRLILHPLDPRAADGSLDKLLFSAKESIFKALFPLTGVWLDFLDVVLELDDAKRRFSGRPAPSATAATPELARLSGSYAVTDDFVITAAWVEA